MYQAVQTKMLMSDTAPEIMRMMLATGALVQPSDVAQIVVDGLEREDFYILSHSETHRQYQQRAADPDRWLPGTRPVSSLGRGELHAAQLGVLIFG